jgi:hypothetical protein
VEINPLIEGWPGLQNATWTGGVRGPASQEALKKLVGVDLPIVYDSGGTQDYFFESCITRVIASTVGLML